MPQIITETHVIIRDGEEREKEEEKRKGRGKGSGGGFIHAFCVTEGHALFICPYLC